MTSIRVPQGPVNTQQSPAFAPRRYSPPNISGTFMGKSIKPVQGNTNQPTTVGSPLKNQDRGPTVESNLSGAPLMVRKIQVATVKAIPAEMVKELKKVFDQAGSPELKFKSPLGSTYKIAKEFTKCLKKNGIKCKPEDIRFYEAHGNVFSSERLDVPVSKKVDSQAWLKKKYGYDYWYLAPYNAKELESIRDDKDRKLIGTQKKAFDFLRHYFIKYYKEYPSVQTYIELAEGKEKAEKLEESKFLSRFIVKQIEDLQKQAKFVFSNDEWWTITDLATKM